MCDKGFAGFEKRKIVIHYMDDHHANLVFLPDSEIKQMVEEVEEE